MLKYLLLISLFIFLICTVHGQLVKMDYYSGYSIHWESNSCYHDTGNYDSSRVLVQAFLYEDSIVIHRYIHRQSPVIAKLSIMLDSIQLMCTNYSVGTYFPRLYFPELKIKLVNNWNDPNHPVFEETYSVFNHKESSLGYSLSYNTGMPQTIKSSANYSNNNGRKKLLINTSATWNTPAFIKFYKSKTILHELLNIQEFEKVKALFHE